MGAQLLGKRILITGAAAGIGLGIARACAAAGASLIVSDIDEDGLAAAAQSLASDSEEIQALKLDVSKPLQVRAFFESLTKRFDRIDGLVNNAGVTVEGSFLDFPEQALALLWETNLRSVFLVSQQAARIMKRAGGGAILNIASNHAVASVHGYEMYAATKGGVSAMTRAMSLSLGPHGIRVNALSPGLTRTEKLDKAVQARPDLAHKFAAAHATGSYATTKQIGEIAVFLLSDGAAAITGADILADHGMSAQLCRAEDLK